MNEHLDQAHLEGFAEEIVKAALRAGADEADVYLQVGRESEVISRMEKIENLKESISQGFGLRVFKNKKLGFSYSSDFNVGAVKIAVEAAVSLAAESTADELNGLPQLHPGVTSGDLQIFDSKISNIPIDKKIEICLQAERTMFEADKRITNSEGAGFYDGDATIVIAGSNGLRNSYKSSFCVLSAGPVAEENGKLQAGSWYSFKRFFDELDSPETVARIAVERTTRMLGATLPKTAVVPIVFDNLTGASLLGSIVRALDGNAIFKEASFLAGRLGEDIGSPLVTLVDDGTLAKGLASAPFDGEGMPTRRKEVISRGKLLGYLYDVYTSRKAKTESTGNAQREYQSLPSIGPHNFYLETGKSSFGEIIQSIKNGLLVTSLMGFGANVVTGDYSLGATGIWIENGELTYPVEGITVAANMLDILKRIDMVGNDLLFMGSVASPTFRVSEMTVSGA